MKRRMLLISTILASIVLFSYLIYLPLSYSSAQIETNDYRVFRKDFCNGENSLLSDLRYSTGEELSYSSSGCPNSDIIISRWSELSLLNQNLLTSRLVTRGYVDVTSLLQIQK